MLTYSKRVPADVLLMFETVEQDVTHDPYSQFDGPFIGIEVGAVKRRHGWFFGIFYSQKEVKAWDFLGEIGKIFGNHLGFDIADVPISQNPG